LSTDQDQNTICGLFQVIDAHGGMIKDPMIIILKLVETGATKVTSYYFVEL
jgi:hypothetical protein